MTRTLQAAPFGVRFWHRKLGTWQIRSFRGDPSQAFLEALIYYRSRCQVDDIKPALINHFGHVWTGKRDAQSRPVWMTEATAAEAE